jgi:hypothetical protein
MRDNEFKDLFNKYVDYLELKNNELSSMFTVSSAAIARWREGVSAPQPLMRENVINKLKALESVEKKPLRVLLNFTRIDSGRIGSAITIPDGQALDHLVGKTVAMREVLPYQQGEIDDAYERGILKGSEIGDAVSARCKQELRDEMSRLQDERTKLYKEYRDDQAEITRLKAKVEMAEGQSLANYQTAEWRKEEITRLRDENEQLRVQLAGCGVVALGNTIKAVKQRVSKGDYGWSASYGDVCDAVDREMRLRDALKIATAAMKTCVGYEPFEGSLEPRKLSEALKEVDAIMSQKSGNCDTSAKHVAADDTKPEAVLHKDCQYYSFEGTICDKCRKFVKRQGIKLDGGK